MNKHIIIIALAASFLVIANVRADVVTLFKHNNADVPTPYSSGLVYRPWGNTATPVPYDPMTASVGAANGPSQLFFCANMPIGQSDAFTDGTGQAFMTALIGDVNTSIMSDYQQASIQSLFNHVYNPLTAAYDHLDSLRQTDSNLRRAATQQAWCDVTILNSALQFAVWEIIHETPGNWNLQNGTVRVDGMQTNQYYPGLEAYYPHMTNPNDAYAEILGLTNSWFDSLGSGIWAADFSDEYFYEITFYYTGTGSNYNISQPLISVTGMHDNHVVPEPATIAVLGLGLAGLGWIRIRRRK